LGEKNASTKELTCAIIHEPLVLGVRRAAGGGWDFMLDHQRRIALIRVGTLTDRRRGMPIDDGPADTWEEIVRALEKSQETAPLNGLILDLRECPGGALNGAVLVADLFLDEGVIAATKYRDETDNDEKSSTRQNSFLEVPIVALIGPDTSGGGEMIAAALQDHRRARIAGQRSRGKASIQQGEYEGLEGGYFLRLTIGYFLRPSGKSLHRFADSKSSDDWGVQPDEDLEVRLSPQLRRQIRAWRLMHDLRPANSRTALPLDDPEKDPVLYVALQELTKRVQEQQAARR
jgi:carboxyl-terminal processing protease